MSKKGTMEAKAAMTELINELDRTRKEYAKATLQLTQLETTVQHLKDAELKKDQIVSHLESELERTAEEHRQQIAVLEEEHRTKDTAWSHRVKHLELEVERLQQENQAMATFEGENRKLRDTVLDNQAVIERLQLINDDLRSRAKEDSKEHAAQLEDEFKRRLAESEKRFRAEAYRALSEEAKLALQGNDHLQTVLQRQNDSIEAVLLRCKQLEQSHTKIQQEQELSTQNLQHHMAEIQRLKKQLADSRTKNTQLEDALKQRKVERASLELLFIEYEASRKQLAKANEKSRRALREAERWRNRAVQLTHELGDEERTVGEMKLQSLQAQSEQVEQHLANRRQRSAQRERRRIKAAEGAAAMRQAEQKDDDVSDDEWSQLSEEEDPSLETKGGHRAINPMEILAMWNVNFDTWRPQGEEGATETPDPVAEGVEQHASTEAIEASASVAKELVESNEALAPAISAHIPELAPVRPPPKAAARAVDSSRVLKDKQLSALAQPKSSLPPPARHFATKPAGTRGSSSKAPLTDLSIVSKGEFKVSKKATDSSQRFLVP